MAHSGSRPRGKSGPLPSCTQLNISEVVSQAGDGRRNGDGTVLEQQAQRTSWGIDIRFADTGQEVTAVARLSGGPSAAIGFGSARYDAVLEPELRVALAAGRSLGALTDSLDYLVQAGVYAGRDEA